MNRQNSPGVESPPGLTAATTASERQARHRSLARALRHHIVRPLSSGLVLLLLAHGACAADAHGVPSRPTIRLAIGGFASETDPASQREQSTQLLDYLTVELSRQAGLELVDRSTIERVVREISLSFDHAARGTNAIKVGQLLGADWLLTGSIQDVGGTNCIVARIIEAQTGVMRDLTCQPCPSNELTAVSQRLAEFVGGALTNSTPFGSRAFLGVGGFENLGVNNRYPELRKELRLTLEQAFRGTPVAVVERTMINPLLNEVRLAMAGLVAPGAVSSNKQPAFVLVDGLYQAVEDGKAGIDLVLRIEIVGGEKHAVSLKASPGQELYQKVVAQVKTTLAGGQPVSSSQLAEAASQLRRGKERARLPQAMAPNYPLGGYFPRDDAVKQRQNITEAIQAFETVLVLQPENTEAKLYLARCLLEPGFEKKGLARDYLLELLAADPGSPLARQAAELFASSYLQENDLQALNLYLAQAARATNPIAKSIALVETFLPLERLYHQGLITREEAVRRLTNSVWAEWAAVEWARTNRPGECAIRNAHPGLGGLTPLNNTFTQFERTLHFDKRAAERVLDDFLPEVTAEHAAFAPHIWGAYLVWRSYRAEAPPPAALIGRLKSSLQVCAETPDRIADRQYFLETFVPELRKWNESNPDAEVLALLDRIAPSAAKPPQSGVARTVPRTASPEPAPATFQLGEPVLDFPGFVTFACDGDRIWVKDDFLPAFYDKRGGPLTYVEWPEEIQHIITCIKVGRDKVWFGTDGSGLVEVDKKALSVRRYAEKDGLLLPNITVLELTDNKLWIGFGRRNTGGLGYLDLNTRRVTSFTRALRPESAGTLLPTLSESDGNGPPRQSVVGIAQIAPDEVWLAAVWNGVQQFHPSTNKWLPHPARLRADNLSCLVANSNYVIYGSVGYHAGLAIYSLKQKRPLPFTGFSPYLKLTLGSLKLPNNMVFSLALDGDKLWVGGLGYLGLVDLQTGRVERLCDLEDEDVRIRRLEIDGKDLWVAAENALHRIPLGAARSFATKD